LLDGLRVRDASDINGAAGPLFADLAPTDLDRVEVLRGSGSSIYGSNAIGGAINLVSATTGGDRHFEFGFDGGSLAQFRERVRGSGGIGKRAGFSFGLSRVDVRHGVDGNDEYGNTAGSGRFQLHPTRSSTLSLNFYGTTSNARINDSPLRFRQPSSANIRAPLKLQRSTLIEQSGPGRRNRLGLRRYGSLIRSITPSRIRLRINTSGPAAGITMAPRSIRSSPLSTLR